MNEEKYAELQMFDYQMKQLQQIAENVDAQILEISKTIEALTEFDKLDGREELLFPVANGIFASGRLSGEKILKINVGDNAVVEKSVSEAIAMMDSQLKELEKYKGELTEQMRKFIEKMQEYQQELGD